MTKPAHYPGAQYQGPDPDDQPEESDASATAHETISPQAEGATAKSAPAGSAPLAKKAVVADCHGRAMEHPEHGMALAMAGRCPWCAERSDDAHLLRQGACGSCGESFGSPELSREVVAAYKLHTRDHLALALVLLTIFGLTAGWFPLLGLLGLLAGFAVTEWRVVRPGLQLMASSRRRMARWTLRLFPTAIAIAVGLSVAAVSGLCLGGFGSALALPLSIGFTWLSARRYLVWQLEREAAGEKPQLAEWALLGGGLSLALGIPLLVGATSAWIIQSITQWISQFIT